MQFNKKNTHSACAVMGKSSVITKQRFPVEAACRMLPEGRIIPCALDKPQANIFPKTTHLTLNRQIHETPANMSNCMWLITICTQLTRISCRLRVSAAHFIPVITDTPRMPGCDMLQCQDNRVSEPQTVWDMVDFFFLLDSFYCMCFKCHVFMFICIMCVCLAPADFRWVSRFPGPGGLSGIWATMWVPRTEPSALKHWVNPLAQDMLSFHKLNSCWGIPGDIHRSY